MMTTNTSPKTWMKIKSKWKFQRDPNPTPKVLIVIPNIRYCHYNFKFLHPRWQINQRRVPIESSSLLKNASCNKAPAIIVQESTLSITTLHSSLEVQEHNQVTKMLPYANKESSQMVQKLIIQIVQIIANIKNCNV